MDWQHIVVFISCIGSFVGLKISGHSDPTIDDALLSAAFFSVGFSGGKVVGISQGSTQK